MKLRELKIRQKVISKSRPEMGVLTVCRHHGIFYLKNADGKRVIQIPNWLMKPDDEMEDLELYS